MGALFFLLVFGLRLATLHGAYHPDDSPETILAGFSGGIQHPPGYPLDSLLTRLAILTLPGSPAFQANLLAALLGSLAALALVLLGAKVTRSLQGDPAAIFSVRGMLFVLWSLGVLGLPQLWFQGLSAKGGIYGLNLLLTLACCGLFWRARSGERPRDLRLGALLAGLGLANHYMSFVLFAPALLYWSWRARPSWSAQAKLALWLLPGLSLYLYLPLRASHEPFLNWGDPQTWPRFVATLLRSQYAAIEAARPAGRTWELTRHFFALLRLELPGLALPLALLGAVHLWRRLSSLRALLLCLALHLGAVLFYNNPPFPWVINAFFLPDLALLWLLTLVGALALMELAPRNAQNLASGLGAIAIVVPLWQLPARYKAQDFSRDFLLYDYNRDLQANLAPNSALLAAGGNDAFGLWFLQGVQGRRQDVTVVDVPLLAPWYLTQLQRRLPELDPAWTQAPQVVNGLLAAPKRPLYYTSHNPGDRGIPLGLVTLVPPPGMALPLTVDSLLGRFQALRLRWVADTRTPMDGNRGELLGYYDLSAQALLGFAQRQNVGPLANGAGRWAQKLRGAAVAAPL